MGGGGFRAKSTVHVVVFTFNVKIMDLIHQNDFFLNLPYCFIIYWVLTSSKYCLIFTEIINL